MTQQIQPAVVHVSIAAELDARAKALTPRQFMSRARGIGRCRHCEELGEAPEHIKRWITVFEQLKAADIRATGKLEAWMTTQEAEMRASRKVAASAHQELELDRRSKGLHHLRLQKEIARMICVFELGRAYPQVEAGVDLMVDADWTVLAIDHRDEKELVAAVADIFSMGRSRGH